MMPTTTALYSVPLSASCAANNLIEGDITQEVLWQIQNLAESDEHRSFSHERLRGAIEDQMRQHDLSSIDDHLRISANILGYLLSLTRTLGYENTSMLKLKGGLKGWRRRYVSPRLEHAEKTHAAYLGTILELLAWRSMVLEAQQAGLEQVTDRMVVIP